MLINTLSINDRRGYKSYRLMIDTGTAGINGNTVRDTIFPAMLDKLGIEYDSFELYGFRYYLGQTIYKVRLTNNGVTSEGHLVSSRGTKEVLDLKDELRG